MSTGRHHRITRYSAVALLATAAIAGVAPPARADGDPASDVLAVQKLFLPADANVSVRQQLQLNVMLTESAKKGYPLRVAIVGSQGDLGSVTALWRRPEGYAGFLGRELALVYHGTVLVVMPNGYGSDVTAPGTRTATGTTQLPLPGEHLGTAAVVAVERFTASAGTPVTTPDVRARAVAHPGDPMPWLVFALGLVPLTLAWILSLRRQPLALRLRRH
jgi:hypothetical protein